MVRTRDPEATRGKLLEAAFGEVHEHGYNAASMDRIVARSGMTKGAMYHHFGSKKALVQEMIDATIRTMVVDSFVAPLAEAENPIDALQGCLRERVDTLTPETVSCGCPLNNLAQELTSTDDEFQAQIEGLYQHWRASIEEALERGQAAGTVRADIDAKDAATFTVAVCAGAAGFAKSSRDVEVAKASVRVLNSYLDTLRTPDA
jgi:TetR/AcrR family transcriptional repressor of nem operon